jgi:MtaA/CmuA family methyltransferase
MTGRERVLRTMRGEAGVGLPNIPITMMKAADIIGVPYRRYAQDAEAHARGQAAISAAFSIDHVSGISDPAVEASDLGAEIFYREDAPPAADEAHALLADTGRLSTLTAPDPHDGPRMRKRIEVVRRLSAEVGHEKAVEGWIEGPIAEACDLRGIGRIMTDFYDEPGFVQDLVAFVIEVETAFAAAQVEAGADYIGIGDAAASLIGPDLYRQFVWEAEKALVASVHRLGVPVRLHICGNIVPLLDMIKEVGAELVDLDSMVPVAAARAALGPRVTLAGNINPVVDLRNATPRHVAEALAACLRDAAGGPYAVAAGCEVTRDTPDENLRAMTEFARVHRPAPAA